MPKYKVLYGLDEEIILNTLDQMAIFTAGLMVKGNTYSVARIEDEN